jgi:hypothetical protein
MPLAPKRDARADGLPLAHLEGGDRLLRAAHDGLLARDARELGRADLDDLGVRRRSPRPMFTTTFSIFGTAMTFV